MKTKYIIEDWAGNRLFINKVFKSYDDAWSYIYEEVDNSKFDKTNCDNDDVYQDLFVVPLN